MLNSLILNNFPSGSAEGIAAEGAGHFIMRTCQRTLVLSYEVDPFSGQCRDDKTCLRGQSAYAYLLEVICGLKSQLLGENEIVGQFKSAYKEYVRQEKIDTKLLLIIEKLFKDAKDIRSKYLLGICQKTYASIARKQIVGARKGDRVLILGSGQLAEDLINQFKKKAQVVICARNTAKVERLKKEHGIESIDWINLKEVETFAFIVNSIGFDGTLFENDFFDAWEERHSNRLFIDLGSPSILETEYGLDHGVMHLQDIFELGAIHESHKKLQIKQARKVMEDVAARRLRLLKTKAIKSKATKTKADPKVLKAPSQKTKMAYV